MAEFDLPEAARRMNGQVWENPGEAFIGTCDAGDCDRETVAIVLTDDGWLSMCREHTQAEVVDSVEQSGQFWRRVGPWRTASDLPETKVT